MWSRYGTAGGAVSGSGGPGEFARPADVAVDSQGNPVVADNGLFRIQKFPPA